ncbi:MAG: thiol reductant ABC exporter subunit CydC [Bifidobacteriaceae bacterium]|jgi:ATP-binding cassette subfamily C protein CydC|nr:thiol reductant ABC exporter subunit CydC [Bifidobacteriaceae bacterium]
MTTSAPKHALRRAIRLTGLKPGPLAAAVFFGALTQTASVALAAVSAWLIVRASQMPPVLSLQIAVVMVRTCGITRGVSRYVERLTAHRVALNGMTELRVRLYERLAAGAPSAAAALRRGDLLARVGADVDDVGDLVVRGLIPTMVAGLLMVGSSVAVGWLLPEMGVALFLCLALVAVGGPALTFRAARISQERANAARSEVSAAGLEILETASELRVGGQMPAARRALKRGEDRLEQATDAAAKPQALAQALTEVGVGLALILALVLSAHAYWDGRLSATALGVVVLTPLACFEAVAGLSAAAAQVYKSRAAARRIVALAEAGHEGQVPDGAQAPAVDEATTLAGPLVATGLAAGWPDGPAVVSDVELTLEPGRSIGLVGPSGAGKTTLLATLAGLLAPQAGRVVIGGTPLVGLDSQTRAAGVVFVAEDAHIFATTVLENLRVARGDVTEAEAHNLLETVGLADWLAALPDGLNTALGTGATDVSGGERRRLLMARALACPARYLLFDEPAEHLDAAAADRLTAGLLAIAHQSGRGVIVVSHRPEALATADQVLAVRGGRLEPVAAGLHS